MDYRDKVFISVAENLSFSKAAEELFISQPAISKHIKALESTLDISLFERKGNKIFLSKAGEITYNSLKKIEQEYRQLEFEIGSLNNSFVGTLKIGASSTISQYVAPKIMASFLKRYPHIKLHLSNGNSFEMEKVLHQNEIDFALVENESSHSDTKYIDFMDDELIVVTGAKSIYAKRKNINLSDLMEIPLILREKGSGTLEVIMHSLAKTEVDVEHLNTLIHLGSTESIKNFLHDFDGIAIVSEKAVLSELFHKQLVKINIKGHNFYRKFRIALRYGQENKSSQLFIDHLLNTKS